MHPLTKLFFLFFLFVMAMGRAFAIDDDEQGKRICPPASAGLACMMVGVVGLTDRGEPKVTKIGFSGPERSFEKSPKSLSLHKSRAHRVFFEARPGKTAQVMAETPPPGGIIGGPASIVRFTNCERRDFSWRPWGGAIEVRFGATWLKLPLTPQLLRSALAFSASDDHTLVDLTPKRSPYKSKYCARFASPVALHAALVGTEISVELPYADLLLPPLPRTRVKALQNQINELRWRCPFAGELEVSCNRALKTLQSDTLFRGKPLTWNFNMVNTVLNVDCGSDRLSPKLLPNLTYYRKSGRVYIQWAAAHSQGWFREMTASMNPQQQNWFSHLSHYMAWQAFFRWVRKNYPRKHREILHHIRKIPRGSVFSPSFMLRVPLTSKKIQSFLRQCVRPDAMKSVP